MGERAARFTDELYPVAKGTAQSRSLRYLKFTGKRAGSLPGNDWHVVQSNLQSVENIDDAYIRAYCGDALYKSVNQSLRANSEHDLRKHGHYIQGLRRSMLRKIKRGENVRSGTVYRKQNLSSERQAMYTPGFKFLWPNFISTSKSNGVWSGNTIFEINLRGHGLTYAIDVASVSPYPHEQEVLLYPYSGFEVLSVENKPGGQKYIKMRTYDTLCVDSRFKCDDMDSDDESAVGGVATCTIVSESNGLALDIAGHKKCSGAKVILHGSHGHKNQQWHFAPDGFIVSALSGLALSIGSGGEAVMQKPGKGGHQTWKFTADGYIESRSKSGHVLTEAGDQVILCSKQGGSKQKWRRG